MKSSLKALLLLCMPAYLGAAEFSPPVSGDTATYGDALLTDYLRVEARLLADNCLAAVGSKKDWLEKRPEYLRQYQEMLGLSPMPERTNLNPVITGRLEGDGFHVEKLYFQAAPGLYCTANLYIPEGLSGPAPTVLYECGHAKSIIDGISYGNKAVYQVDGAWYARNGYVCLVVDTLLAGEIQGIHTGTRDHGLWWWNSRGYTPSGVEAWIGIRALDYLSTRPEVDMDRIGITGHSGGGAYSWAVTALDDRIKAAAPLAGMTDLHRHVLDNLMDSHCDCNFPINYHRWDFPQLAALAAPRPLLIGGTDYDRIFPLEGTLSIHEKVRRVYDALGAKDQLGLVVAPGGHDEVPEFRLAVMRWFNRHLKGITDRHGPSIVVEAKRFFTPQQLKVFDTLPADSINADIAETWVARAAPMSRSAAELRDRLLETSFAGWPSEVKPRDVKPLAQVEREGLQFTVHEFMSQHDVPLKLYTLESKEREAARPIRLSVLDEANWASWLGGVSVGFKNSLNDELATVGSVVPDSGLFDQWKNELNASSMTMAFFAPRGVGLTVWSGDAKRLRKVRRRFMTMGQTADSMRVWDIQRAVAALDGVHGLTWRDLEVESAREMGINVLYAALFERRVDALRLSDLPETHLEGPDYLGILKVTDVPEVMAAVADMIPLRMRR